MFKISDLLYCIALIASLVSTIGYSSELNSGLTIDKAIFDVGSLDFIEHNSGGSSYLAVNIPIAPVNDLFNDLSEVDKISLKKRGEAHITVITPVEFQKYFAPAKVRVEEINKMAKEFQIQNIKFDVLCLGKGSAKIKGKEESTFYIVVESKELIQLRENAKKLLEDKHGATQFDPNNYHPHITVGFTKEDLHEAQGVIKDTQSCIHQLVVN